MQSKARSRRQDYLERGVPQSVNMDWHHVNLVCIIALEVHNCADAPGIAHVYAQAQRLLVKHVQQVNLCTAEQVHCMRCYACLATAP